MTDPALAEIPVCVISAASNLGTIPLQEGGFLPKPLKLNHLLQ